LERISRFGQVKVYVGKCFRAFKNERGWKMLISAGIIAIIISWVAGDDMFLTYSATRSGAFALVCACIWTGIFNSIQSICRERAIIKRENRTGLHISSYIVAHMIYEMVLSFIQAFITTVIVVIMRHPPTNGIFTLVFTELLITFFLVIFAADVLGMLVSCIAKNETAAMTAMPFVLILQLVMSGIIFELQGAASFVSNLTISKWGVNAICSISNVNMMLDALFAPNFDRSQYTFLTSHLAQLWMILIVFTLIYGILAVFSLKMVSKDKR